MSERIEITDEEIDTINRTRTTLRAIHDRAYYDHTSQASGMVKVAADAAADALFALFNVAQTYGGRTMTYEQIHGTTFESKLSPGEPDDRD